MATPLFTALLRLADDHLILGHRLSEWCGHAPMLEEDLALPNIALDLIGQARALYTYAGEVEGAGRDEDALAYGRHERGYVNALICETENGDFARTMYRQCVFAVFMGRFWEAAVTSSDPTLAAIAAKARKETAYHIRHSAEWVIRMGDGTDESTRRMRDAATYLAPYIGELFEADTVTDALSADGIWPDPPALQSGWIADMTPILDQALLPMPDLGFAHTGGRQGVHTEGMGYLLAELHYMQRAYPGLTW
ncbi:1,2-phenylacetyl-CoA epoxidase subunit PaaC [Pseudaestuariivita atlantica]|uniref:Phenylacetic acid degradation protein n=1 Tax=Pseudaestuariivita atlantica TaxID=1317121 RepID=A0A0L1JNC8_9RHOB|nr:1,2-phenylacetyl-CoA epoxidase subunit PaaC [Pseudaestuariivita atlantica]KNG93265.1 phenylacetic acid degradation protein [Pseudaestuariivita atlantica]